MKTLLRMVVPGVVGLLQVFAQGPNAPRIGAELAVPHRLQDGEEYKIALPDLIDYGRQLFTANWTVQEGAGRPQVKGTGEPLADPSAPLVFPRNFNRISGPDSNSCAGCHNMPVAGGSGDIVANVFVLGQRFDFADFAATSNIPGKGALDELGRPVTLQNIANERATIGMFGSGYIEMLSRQMTADLQALRNMIGPGESRALMSKGVSFGTISRNMDGTWDTTQVEGISPVSLRSTGPNDPPSLILRVFHQAGRVVSLREFTNNAYNHHHGMQSTERFGVDTDPDGDGVKNELNRADITAVTVFQATLPVPVQVLPRDPAVLKAVEVGQDRFASIGCAGCHTPALPLDNQGWIYTEPNPYNPAGNLQPGQAPVFKVDLTSDALPGQRLRPNGEGVIMVPAFTDLKLHDICAGPNDPNMEPLDMQAKPGSAGFFHGNRRFITRALWGVYSQPPFFHHGQYTTMREAILAHSGEAEQVKQKFIMLPQFEQDSVIEFLKTLQIRAQPDR